MTTCTFFQGFHFDLFIVLEDTFLCLVFLVVALGVVYTYVTSHSVTLGDIWKSYFHFDPLPLNTLNIIWYYNFVSIIKYYF
jgi:hypothetical protein